MAAPGGIDITLLVNLLSVFIIAAGVGVFVAKWGHFPYTIALLLAGLTASVLGITMEHIVLSHDLILLVLLPPLLFEGAATTDLTHLRRNLGPILAMAVVGLVLSVTVLGVAGTYAFGFPLVVSLLFAAMILPTDPVSVLALFEELGAPERLATLVEGESLVNDGVGVVLFSSLLVYATGGQDPATLFTRAGMGELVIEVAVVSLGGLVVGLAAGAVVSNVMASLDEHMTEIVLTIILAYGAFVLAEHYLHVSGVIATVVAGLFIGNRGVETAMSPQTKISVFNTWEAGAFLVNTFIFIMIGVKTPVGDLLAHAELIAVAVVLVLAARALAVYPITFLVNRVTEPRVPHAYQHVMLWGGLHASIPIALVLGLPPETPFRASLRAMVFGVAAFSLVVQGLTMSPLMDRLGIVTRTEAEELYELLVGRARAVDAALEAAEDLHDRGEITGEVYEDFTVEYEREKTDLDEAIGSLLAEAPEIRREQVLAGERRLLRREKSAIMGAARSGVVSDDVGEALLEETDLKLDRVRTGESTVAGEREGYEEFWRGRARAYGLEAGRVEAGRLEDAGSSGSEVGE
ncbi:MAG: cation:proton antiporter [Haloarculaceae archaeon]